jgi:hypothetical protein
LHRTIILVYTLLLSTIVGDSIMPSRPMNKGRSNDHDFVPPTQYKSSRTKQPRPSLLSQLEQIPKFEAMELENIKGSSQIPCTSSPEDLFSLFLRNLSLTQGRTAQACEKRKVLQELSENSIRFNQNGEKSRRPRPPRTKYGCSVCQIHLCKGGSCWEEHTQLSKLID